MIVHDIAEYQRESAVTWRGVEIQKADLAYLTLGLCNEAGEFAGKVKKMFRDRHGDMDESMRRELESELGDVLWYLTRLCDELDTTVLVVAQRNLDKLLDRKERGKVYGDGDHR